VYGVGTVILTTNYGSGWGLWLSNILDKGTHLDKPSQAKPHLRCSELFATGASVLCTIACWPKNPWNHHQRNRHPALV